MRDPLTWSVPLGRLFGVIIRVHVIFPLIVVGLLLRAVFLKDPPWPNLVLDVAVVLLLVFVAVLLHELGHCFGARLVDGDASEVLLWPLGGLVPPEVPQTPRALFIATAAGPATNLLLCIAMGLLLASNSFRPVLNPWSIDADPLAPRLHKWTDGYAYGWKYHAGDPTEYTVKTKDGETKALARSEVEERILKEDKPKEAGKEPTKQYFWKDPKDNTEYQVTATRPATLEHWVVLVTRFFWVNWILFLVNLLPGLPLDGGRLLQSILWWRGEHRQAMVATITVGFFVMVVVFIYSIVINELLVFFLAMVIYATCHRQWYILETGGEEPMFGYDFSQGYTSLERDPPLPAQPKQPNFIQRWLQKRAQKKLQRQQEVREAEELRLDQLLDKVKDSGMQSLTDEERRFLTRVSSRYKNRK